MEDNDFPSTYSFEPRHENKENEDEHLDFGFNFNQSL